MEVPRTSFLKEKLMKNFILLIAILGFFLSCQTSKKPLPIQEAPISLEKFSIMANPSDTIKLEAALLKRKEVLQSKCFSDFMLNRKLIQTNGLSNEEVVLALLNTPVKAEFQTYYKRFSKVYGYTYPNISTIFINKKYFDGASICSVASNQAHEISHKQGFGHDYKATTRRPYSVPYSINAAFSECCK